MMKRSPTSAKIAKGPAPRPLTWHDVPHSPLPFRDGGAGVFVDANGHVPFRIIPFERRNEDPGVVYERFKGDYHYLLCAVNCHEELLTAAKRLADILGKAPKKNAAEIARLQAVIAHAESHFE